jgi:hypothetical protein
MEVAMSEEVLKLDCAEWREVAGENPSEMEVVIEMMIEAEEELCVDRAA